MLFNFNFKAYNVFAGKQGQNLIPDFEQVLVCDTRRVSSGAPGIWILSVTSLRCSKVGQSAKVVVLQ